DRRGAGPPVGVARALRRRRPAAAAQQRRGGQRRPARRRHVDPRGARGPGRPGRGVLGDPVGAVLDLGRTGSAEHPPAIG
ncbi:hypothetical protein PSD17_29080, partial [Pseudonocardia sp. D17]